MTLPADLGHILHLPKLQAAGGASGDAGRFQPLVDAVHAVIAFFNLSGLLIPLGSAPGAGRDTGFASHTKVLIDENNPVLTPPLHGAGGAGRHAPWIFTVKTGHKNKRYLGDLGNGLGAHLDNLAGPGPGRQIFICLALDLTGPAPDTFFGILEQIILAHLCPPT